MQIYFIFFVLPLFGLYLLPLVAGIIALGLNFGAYGAHIFRATIQNVDRGQWEVATALNMTPAQRMRRVILPQAMFAMIPLFGNELIRILKATSLLSAVTITELTFAGKVIVQHTGQSAKIYTVVLIIYFCIAFPLSRCVKWIEKYVHTRFGVTPLQEREARTRDGF